jgi:hypothetical protein
VPGLIGVPFNYALNIVVQRVEFGTIWGPELLGPKYIHVVAEPILHQMAIMFSALLEYMRLANSYLFDP